MDQSFNDRVDKVFGSISSSSSTPWSLTDAQVEKRVWNRHKADNKDDDDETLVSSSFDNLFNGRRNRRKSLDEDDEDVGGDDAVETENDGDEWDIRSSIGLDSTLDNEEEEDAYDKMAEGRENGDECERVYMKDVTDHGPYLNSHNVLPSLVHAKTRLKEEDDDDEPMLNAEEVEACVPAASREWEGGYGMRIKSILKRKNDNVVNPLKPTAKRVRFDPSCNKTDELRNGIQVQVQGFASSGNVPDYVVNPSKYTRYDFDEEGSNRDREAYLDIMESKHVGVEESLPTSSSSSVVFIPRKKKKRGDDDDDDDGIGIGIGEAAAFNHVHVHVREEQAKAKRSSTAKGIIAIAALELEVQQQEGEAISQEMQEEEEEESHVCSKKPGRRYRSRIEQDDDDDNAS